MIGEYTLVIAGTQSASGPGFMVLTGPSRGGGAAARLDLRRRPGAVMSSNEPPGELPVEEPSWLVIGRELSAIAQIGLTFCRDPFDRQRFERIRELAASLIAQGSGRSREALLEYFRRARGLRDSQSRCARRGILRRAGAAGARDQRRRVDAARGLGRCEPVGRRMCGARSRGRIRLPGAGVKLAAVYDYRKRNRPHHLDSIYKMFFICELIGGSARASIETSEASFFARDALPPLSVGRTTAAQIERMFQHAENPQLPTDFD